MSLSKFCESQLLGKILRLPIPIDQDKKGVVRSDVIYKYTEKQYLLARSYSYCKYFIIFFLLQPSLAAAVTGEEQLGEAGDSTNLPFLAHYLPWT